MPPLRRATPSWACAATAAGNLPVLCPGCRSPIPPDTPKCPWCGRNVNQGGADDEQA